MTRTLLTRPLLTRTLLTLTTLAALATAQAAHAQTTYAQTTYAQTTQTFGGLYTTSFATPAPDPTRTGVTDGMATFTITPNLPTPFLFSTGNAALFTTPAAASPTGTIVYNETTGGTLTATAPGYSGVAYASLATDGVLTYTLATQTETYAGTFTFSGGTGDFAGASGTGTISAATGTTPGKLSGAITFTPAPEPSACGAFAIGLLGLGALALKAKKRVA